MPADATVHPMTMMPDMNVNVAKTAVNKTGPETEQQNHRDILLIKYCLKGLFASIFNCLFVITLFCSLVCFVFVFFCPFVWFCCLLFSFWLVFIKSEIS